MIVHTAPRRLHTFWLIGAALAGAACSDDPAPTEPAAVSEPALATGATAVTFDQLSSGEFHTCGITADNRLYCWGFNGDGQLGDGTTTDRLTPVPVAPELRFRYVSSGNVDTCAITTEYQAYCWGENNFGNLGDGTNTQRLTPTPVVGGHQFRQVAASESHTCAVALADNRAYCWGFNNNGQLGDGTATFTTRPTPAPVASMLAFRHVSVGIFHSCGVATDNRAYCWGDNQRGQLGVRTEDPRRTTPSLVADGHRFIQLDAGTNHNCAVRPDNKAFCWGDGRAGQFGNGHTYLSFWPRAVSGGHLFERVTAGRVHSCGETTTNRAYCWGQNTYGSLGDGTNVQRLTPVAVTGGLFFSQLSAGQHTCGRTDTGKSYCWGLNQRGQVGDGTTTNRSTPTPVAGAS